MVLLNSYLATTEMEATVTYTVKVGNLEVGPDRPATLIAEIGINHNGSMDLLKKLVDIASSFRWNMVKIQTRINRRGALTDVYSDAELAKPREVPRILLEQAIARGVIPPADMKRLVESNFASTTTHDQKRAIELTKEELREFVRYANDRNLTPFSSPWCVESVNVLEEVGVPCYKVASACATDDDLLTAIAETGKPVFLSTGMMDLFMVEHAVETLLKRTTEDRIIIMHCSAVYSEPPVTPGEDLSAFTSCLELRCIETLRKRFDPIPIGFSGNETGIQSAYAAAVLGAVAIEKHVTLHRRLYGSDQNSAIEPDEMMRLSRMTRELPFILGTGTKMFHRDEIPTAKKLRKVGPTEPPRRVVAL